MINALLLFYTPDICNVLQTLVQSVRKREREDSLYALETTPTYQ